MRDCQFSRSLRIISTVVLSFFIWTFCGIFDIAYAIKDGQRSGVNSQKSNSSQKTTTHKAEEKFGRDLEDIDDILKDEKADHETKKKRIRGKRGEIEAADTEIKKQFKDTEEKLKGLPEEIKKRHREFVKKYEDNLRELKADLEEIQKHSAESIEFKRATEKTKAFLERVKAPKRYKKLDPNKLPHRSADPVFIEPRTKPEQFLEDRNELAVMGNEIKASKNSSRITHHATPLLVAANGPLNGLLNSPAPGPLTPDPVILALATPPSAADLAETIEVQFTPEIRQLAADLEYNPTKIFNFVRNYIEFVPTYGSIQGAHRTLLTGRGNSFDQASLLIALLRVSGIASKYEYGTVQGDIDKIKNLVGGFSDSMAALRLMASGGIPVKGLVEGGAIKAVQFEHIWVSAWIDYIPSRGAVHKQGDTWISLDPSFKQYNFTPGVDFKTVVPFDLQSYLNEVKSTAVINESEGSITGVNTDLAQARVDEYGAQIEAYLTTNYPNAIEDRIVRNGEIIRKKMPFLPLNLPYTVIATGWTAPSMPANLRHKITFSVSKDIYDELDGTALNFTISLPEIVRKRITLSYSPASAADKATLRSLIPKSHSDGTPLQISELPSSFPSYLINLKPELRIGGQVVATGSIINMGYSEQLTIALQTHSKSVRAVDKELIAGEYYAVGLDVMPLEEDAIEEKILNHYDLLEQVKAKTVYPEKDDLYGEFLHTIAVGYFDQADAFEQRYAKVMGIVTHRLPSIGIVQSSLKVKYIFGSPIAASPEGLFLDIPYVSSIAVALYGDNEKAKDFNFLTGLYDSGLEHAVPEQLFSSESNPIEGVSAVKILSVANSQNIPIYTITAANISTVLPKIQTGISSEIRDAINAGKEVITPERNVIINGWTGTGYIVLDPKTGDGAYVITGGKNGGFLTALGAYWIACGTVIYDDDPMFGMEVIQSGINLIIEAQDLWLRVLKTAGKVAFEIGMNFVPWGKVAGSVNMAFGCMAGNITKNAVTGKAFEKVGLKILEQVLKVSKNTKKFPTSLGNTIPDGTLAEAMANPTVLWEIKSSMYVCNTANLPKMIELALEHLHVPLNLLVKEGAEVSKPLAAKIAETGGKIYKFNVLTGKTIPPL